MADPALQLNRSLGVLEQCFDLDTLSIQAKALSGIFLSPSTMPTPAGRRNCPATGQTIQVHLNWLL